MIWAAGDHIVKTTDGGQTWIQLTGSGHPAWGFYGLEIDSIHKFLYAGAVSKDGGLLKSTDGGSNWFTATNGLLSNKGYRPHINQKTNYLYVVSGSDTGGLYESRNFAGCWDRLTYIPPGGSLRKVSISRDEKYIYRQVGLAGNSTLGFISKTSSLMQSINNITKGVFLQIIQPVIIYQVVNMVE